MISYKVSFEYSESCVFCLGFWMFFCANTVLYLYQVSCKTVVEVVEAVPKDDQGVQADQDDSNHDGSGRQEHFSQVLGLSISRKLERHVCQEVAWETWCRSEEQSTTGTDLSPRFLTLKDLPTWI